MDSFTKMMKKIMKNKIKEFFLLVNSLRFRILLFGFMSSEHLVSIVIILVSFIFCVVNNVVFIYFPLSAAKPAFLSHPPGSAHLSQDSNSCCPATLHPLPYHFSSCSIKNPA
jgi:hypothetical protein